MCASSRRLCVDMNDTGWPWRSASVKVFTAWSASASAPARSRASDFTKADIVMARAPTMASSVPVCSSMSRAVATISSARLCSPSLAHAYARVLRSIAMHGDRPRLSAKKRTASEKYLSASGSSPSLTLSTLRCTSIATPCRDDRLPTDSYIRYACAALACAPRRSPSIDNTKLSKWNTSAPMSVLTLSLRSSHAMAKSMFSRARSVSPTFAWQNPSKPCKWAQMGE
mmetsp:Transcript_97687/g.298509  ORF Transcript_97687/g.298509 Transcript_97687/m.298509 type:complete len:227 (-) Transcript_97687:1300-1980(-)